MLNVPVTISTLDDKNRQYKFWKFRITTYIVQITIHNQIQIFTRLLSAHVMRSPTSAALSLCLLVYY
jgi:hypothetical protein